MPEVSTVIAKLFPNCRKNVILKSKREFFKSWIGCPYTDLGEGAKKSTTP